MNLSTVLWIAWRPMNTEGLGSMEYQEKESSTRDKELVERAIRLFEFLKRVQQVKSTPIRNIEAYAKDGAVLWLGGLPDDSAVQSNHRIGGLDDAAPVMWIDRVQHDPPPSPPESVTPWLDRAFDDPHDIPSLVESRTIFQDVGEESWEEPGGKASSKLALSDFPVVTSQYEDWWVEWSTWAEEEIRLRPIRDAYAELFSMYISSTSHPEELELVLGVGCLAWQERGQPAVVRHAFVAQIVIEFDDSTGRLTVQPIEATDTLKL